ncbi:hypothetical protein [uncultured Treponema sp.]|uniref:hypothetical protein n=1 Tax=uncultured Treponema sp. TaxID=162155 RepID=UPI00259581DC|nr:hypothetical protein [uncultured Treponema sp.]
MDKKKLPLRSKYKYDSIDFIILYIAEFILRKDHEFFIKNILELRKRIPNLKVIMPRRAFSFPVALLLQMQLEKMNIRKN